LSMLLSVSLIAAAAGVVLLSTGTSHAAGVLSADSLKKHVEQFNADDEELFQRTASDPPVYTDPKRSSAGMHP
jgi:hypothetical protein